jgi:glycosyltransferase involved in cell wall biosynthesis
MCKNILNNTILISLYSHPESYPPTLNAITELSKLYKEIVILYRPFFKDEWIYPVNVTLIPSGKKMNVREQEAKSLLVKIFLFVQFKIKMLGLLLKYRPKTILLYDAFPLFAYYLIKKILIVKPAYVWYHNHDVPDKTRNRKFSIGWFATNYEHSMFAKTDIFSLPSNERKKYYPVEKLKGKYFFLPNYPSLKVYNQWPVLKTNDTIRILFQGHIDVGHGIEQLLQLMPFTVCNKPIQLVLKGILKQDAKERLAAYINKDNKAFIEIHGYTSYQELIKITSSCHIGLAIHTGKDIMNTTLGTASNKIYEYAACGLPVVYFDNEHYNAHLSKHKWAFATDLSNESLFDCIQNIMYDFDKLSASARKDFENELNFEKNFSHLCDYLHNN